MSKFMKVIEYAIELPDREPDDNWVTDFAQVFAEAEAMEKNGLSPVILQREVTYTPSYPVRTRVDMKALVNELENMLTGTSEKYRDAPQGAARSEAIQLAVSALPIFTEALVQVVLQEAREIYGDSEILAPKLEAKENFALMLRSIGGVSGWSNVAGTPPQRQD